MRILERIVLVGLVAACDLGDPGLDGSASDTWTLEAVPALVIDSLGAEPLYGIGSVASSSDRIAIADRGNHLVAVFDGSGHLLHTLGRKGAGPGEFESVSDVFYLANDSVLTYDSRLARFQVFDPDGHYARAFAFSAGDDPDLRTTTPVAVLNPATIIARHLRRGAAPPEGAGVSRVTADVLRFSMDGRLLDTIAVVPGWEAYATQANGVYMTNVPIPFSNSTYMAGAAGQLVLASTDSNEVRLYSAAGALLHTIGNAAPPGPAVTSDEIEAFKVRAIEGAPVAMRQQLEVVYAEMPYPPTKAPFSWIYAGADSSIWLRVPQPDAGRDAFNIFDASQASAATLNLPAEFSPMVVSHESVLGVWTDSLGVESVRAFGILR